MNKALIILVFFLGTITSGYSQESLSFGIKGGVNFATFEGREFLIDQKIRSGFHFGIFIGIPLSEKFSLQPELLYSQQGSKIDEDIFITTGPADAGVNLTIETISKFDYINLPILINYKITDGLSLGLGPQVGFNISAKLDGSSSNEEILPVVSSLDVSDLTETLDVGFALNAQYDLFQRLSVQVRYVLGITNVDVSDVQNSSSNDDPLLNRNLQLSVGYKF